MSDSLWQWGLKWTSLYVDLSFLYTHTDITLWHQFYCTMRSKSEEAKCLLQLNTVWSWWRNTSCSPHCFHLLSSWTFLLHSSDVSCRFSWSLISPIPGSVGGFGGFSGFCRNTWAVMSAGWRLLTTFWTAQEPNLKLMTHLQGVCIRVLSSTGVTWLDSLTFSDSTENRQHDIIQLRNDQIF